MGKVKSKKISKLSTKKGGTNKDEARPKIIDLGSKTKSGRKKKQLCMAAHEATKRRT